MPVLDQGNREGVKTIRRESCEWNKKTCTTYLLESLPEQGEYHHVTWHPWSWLEVTDLIGLSPIDEDVEMPEECLREIKAGHQSTVNPNL